MIHLPRVGQILQLTRESPDGKTETYRTRVAELSDDRALIEIPIEEGTGRWRRFPPGTPITISYHVHDGVQYLFQTEVVGEKKEQIPLLEIQIPPADRFQRTQRRNYLRVKAMMDLAVKLNDKMRMYHFLTVTTDLGGGGLSFRCPTQYRLKEGDQLELWLALPNRFGHVEHVHTMAEIIRVEPVEANGAEGRQHVSVKFKDILQGEQAKIVRCCYDQQLSERKSALDGG